MKIFHLMKFFDFVEIKIAVQKKLKKKIHFHMRIFFLNEKLNFVDEELRKKEKCSRNLEGD